MHLDAISSQHYLQNPTANLELADFLRNISIPGQMNLKLDRHQDFFSTYKIQSDHFRAYSLKDDQKKIQAIAGFVYRQAQIYGRIIQISTATDLFVNPDRRARVEWSKQFIPVLQKETQDIETECVFSYINLSNLSTANTLIRPRAINNAFKRTHPRYYLYRKFQLVSLHGYYPWTPRPVSSIRIREGHENFLEPLIKFLVHRSKFRPFSSVWDDKSFFEKMNRLPGFKLSDFLIAFNSQDEIIGCLAPWSPRSVQNFIPLSYSLRAHNFRQFLKFLWLFGLTRRLSKPSHSAKVSLGLAPEIENPLNFQFLTNVFADNEDIFASLLYSAYEKAGPDSFLLYAHNNQDYRLRPPLHWISSSTPYALYSITPPEIEPPTFLYPSIHQNPEIEAYRMF